MVVSFFLVSVSSRLVEPTSNCSRWISAFAFSSARLYFFSLASLAASASLISSAGPCVSASCAAASSWMVASRGSPKTVVSGK